MKTIYKIRYILNILFLVCTVLTLIFYFTVDNNALFFYTGVVALSFKMVEFILRFI
ncbi:MAG: hypothetical protein IKJ31_04915 [Bacteroidaceae bacterium]|nr:hypothetical protein [Bacteroidaceae bacterium]